mmetsp:Transcript_16733/g.42364  ORF Transcript_16733/g.42364 Transcript_16733/m.42364 type:complete len:260 (+) Transcript_16733:356-1135(+)
MVLGAGRVLGVWAGEGQVAVGADVDAGEVGPQGENKAAGERHQPAVVISELQPLGAQRLVGEPVAGPRRAAGAVVVMLAEGEGGAGQVKGAGAPEHLPGRSRHLRESRQAQGGLREISWSGVPAVTEADDDSCVVRHLSVGDGDGPVAVESHLEGAALAVVAVALDVLVRNHKHVRRLLVADGRRAVGGEVGVQGGDAGQAVVVAQRCLPGAVALAKGQEAVAPHVHLVVCLLVKGKGEAAGEVHRHIGIISQLELCTI